MLDRSRVWWVLCGVLAVGCTTAPPPVAERPVPAPAPPAQAAPAPQPVASPSAEAALAEEARALLAQAETDVQRARSKRALWQKAWEDLLASRRALGARDHARAIRHAKRASEFALLGLEQLVYPAVK